MTLLDNSIFIVGCLAAVKNVDTVTFSVDKGVRGVHEVGDFEVIYFVTFLCQNKTSQGNEWKKAKLNILFLLSK